MKVKEKLHVARKAAKAVCMEDLGVIFAGEWIKTTSTLEVVRAVIE